MFGVWNRKVFLIYFWLDEFFSDILVRIFMLRDSNKWYVFIFGLEYYLFIKINLYLGCIYVYKII